jgi:hypothetical protein
MNIISAMNDPRFFRPLFKDLSTWNSWQIFLSALYGLGIKDKKDRRLFRRCTGLKRVPSKQAIEALCICGRGSGKSFIISVNGVYLACFKDWSPYLSPGEIGWIFIIANDREQARIIMNYIKGILNSSPSFKKMVKKELAWEIELTNNINIAVKTCSFKAVRGYTLVAAICEEIAFWRDEHSANPAQEILTALRPGLARIPNSLLIGISTPYSRSGVLWEMYRSHFGSTKRDAPLIWQAPTLIMNPTISREAIRRGYKQDANAARAEWDAQFREDLEAFLGLEMIENSIVPMRVELPRIKDVNYFGFSDPSGGRQDSMTLGIAHVDERTGKVVLDSLREAQAPFVPKQVVKDFAEVLRSYQIGIIKADRYAAEWVTSEFRDNEILVENSELSSSEIYLSALPLFSNSTIELLDSKRLVSQLRSLERRTRPGGKDLVIHPQFSWAKDDLAVAACGAIVNAYKSETDKGYGELLEESIRHSYALEDELTEKEKMDRESVRWLLGEGDVGSEEQRDKERRGENPSFKKGRTQDIRSYFRDEEEMKND